MRLRRPVERLDGPVHGRNTWFTQTPVAPLERGRPPSGGLPLSIAQESRRASESAADVQPARPRSTVLLRSPGPQHSHGLFRGRPRPSRARISTCVGGPLILRLASLPSRTTPRAASESGRTGPRPGHEGPAIARRIDHRGAGRHPPSGGDHSGRTVVLRPDRGPLDGDRRAGGPRRAGPERRYCCDDEPRVIQYGDRRAPWPLSFPALARRSKV